jgi:hypothetical protein
MYVTFCFRDLYRKDHFGYLDIAERLILKWTIKIV